MPNMFKCRFREWNIGHVFEMIIKCTFDRNSKTLKQHILNQLSTVISSKYYLICNIRKKNVNFRKYKQVLNEVIFHVYVNISL